MCKEKGEIKLSLDRRNKILKAVSGKSEVEVLFEALEMAYKCGYSDGISEGIQKLSGLLDEYRSDKVIIDGISPEDALYERSD